MTQIDQIAFLLCDGNTRIEVPSQNLPFRELSKNFQLKIPFEFVLLLDLNTNKLRSKNEILNNGSVFKIIDARMELETVKIQNYKIDKLEFDIQQLKQKNSELEQLNEQYKTQYRNEKINSQQFKKIYDQQNKELIELKQEQAIDRETIKKFEFREHEWNLKNSIIQELKDKVKEQEKKIENFLQSLSECKAKVTMTEDKLKSIQDKYELLKQFKKKFQEKEYQNQQQQNQIQTLEKKMEKYKSQKSEYQNQQAQFFKTQTLQQPSQVISQETTQSTSQFQSLIQQDFTEKCLKLEQQLNDQKQENQKLTDRLQNYEKFKKENESLKQEQITFNQIIKDLKEQISQQDSIVLKQIERREMELQNLKTSNLEKSYRHKLLRLIELIPRSYFSEINFAIDHFNGNGVNKSLKTIPTNLKVYQIVYTRKYIQLVLFSTSLEEITNQFKILKLSNYDGILTNPIESITNHTVSEGTIIDQLSIFQSKTIGQKPSTLPNLQNQFFALKTIKNTTYNQQYEENQSILYENTQEDALQQVANLLVSKEILNEFQQDLIAFGKKIEIKHQFTNFYIFSTTHPFNEIMVLIKNQIREKDKIPRGFHFLYDFVLDLDDEASNNFFGQLQEIQVIIKENNKKVNQQMLIKPIFQDFIELCKCQSKVIKNLNNFTEQEIVEAIQFFFIQNYDFPKFYPFEKFYPAYEINFDVNQKQQLIQYNGGHLAINYQEKESSYYWALSYYSIVKTNGQFCLSYLQRIGEYLYEPLISTQDGFFSSMDQGLSEIRTIESTFLSSKYYPEWKSFFEWLSKIALE